MKLHHIILSLLIIASSCISDDAIENNESDQQDLIIETRTNNANRIEISEDLHIALQEFSYTTAKTIYENQDVREGVSTYLANSNKNTISTRVLFSEDFPVDLLKQQLINCMGNCCPVPSPERPYHRPGILPPPDNGGGFIVGSLEYCADSFINSIYFRELMVYNETELFFPNGLDFIADTPSHLRTISSTSSPNLSLLRENEGYRFFPYDNVLAEIYYNLEYPNGGVDGYGGENPIRVNTTNNYLSTKESIVIARVKINTDKY